MILPYNSSSGETYWPLDKDGGYSYPGWAFLQQRFGWQNQNEPKPDAFEVNSDYSFILIRTND